MRLEALNSSTRLRLDIAQEVEGQPIGSALDARHWTLTGRRNRIFVLVSGSGSITYTGETYPLQAPNLVWVPTGQVAQVTLFAGSRGAWLALSDGALGQVTLPGNIAEDIRRFSLRPQLVGRIDREAASRLSMLISSMEPELRDNRGAAQEVVRYQLAIVLILLWRISELATATQQPAPRTVVSDFLHLVDQQMRRHWSVGDYARYLGVSIDRLNSAVQRATGQTPLGLIHSRLIAEAQQMLEISSMQIAEIALSLGFDDPAYFSRFFKRLSGRSPRQYRFEAARSHVDVAGSFAAWP